MDRFKKNRPAGEPVKPARTTDSLNILEREFPEGKSGAAPASQQRVLPTEPGFEDLPKTKSRFVLPGDGDS